MKNHLNIIFTFLFLFCICHYLQSQTFIGNIKINDESQTHILIFKDGKTKTGRILSIKNLEVVFFDNDKNSTTIYKLSHLDKIMVKRSDLDLTNITGRAIAQAEEEKLRRKKNPKVKGNNRLFFTETGFALEQGTSEYHTIRGVIHNVEYGLTDGVTVGLGFVYPDHFTGHIKINYIGKLISSKLRGGFDFSVAVKPEKLEEDEDLSGFLKMGTYFSYGTPDRNAHLGLSITPVFQQDFDDFFITFNFGGTLKVAPHWRIIYENVFGGSDFGGAFGFFSGLGVHWFNKKNGIKAGLTSAPSFGFFNIPLNNLNNTSQLPFFSYSRYF